MIIQLAGANEPHLQFGGLGDVPIGEPNAADRETGKAADDETHPEVLRAGALIILRGHRNHRPVQSARFEERFVFRLGHPGRLAPTRTTLARWWRPSRRTSWTRRRKHGHVRSTGFARDCGLIWKIPRLI